MHLSCDRKSEALYGSKICTVGRTNAAYGGGHLRYSCLISIANTSPPVWRAVPLTTYLGAEVIPALSPDNSRVAFTWNGEKQDYFDIYVQPIGPGRPQRLTTDPAQDRARRGRHMETRSHFFGGSMVIETILY